jgi:NAD(P)-dependent dehydrogenase (short-subunit alcohol dehydrogenase family)
MGKLDGKVAVVTGAARGLGRAYAKQLAGLGAKVAVADLNLHSYEEFEAEAKDIDCREYSRRDRSGWWHRVGHRGRCP